MRLSAAGFSDEKVQLGKLGETIEEELKRIDVILENLSASWQDKNSRTFLEGAKNDVNTLKNKSNNIISEAKSSLDNMEKIILEAYEMQ